MKRFPTLFVLFLLTIGLHAQNIKKLRDCDLLFHVTPYSSPITEATSENGLPIDHVGIFYRLNGEPVVIEATYRGVVITPLEKWMKHLERIYIGRIRDKIDKQQSIANALSYVGKSYDYLFQEGDDEIYCTELIQLSFVDKLNNPIFEKVPMSFHDASGHVMPYWEDYYSRRSMTVPEGKPGTNPSEMAHRTNIKLFKWTSK